MWPIFSLAVGWIIFENKTVSDYEETPHGRLIISWKSRSHPRFCPSCCHFAVDGDLAHVVGCINTTARQRRWPFEGFKRGRCHPFRANGSKSHWKRGCWFLISHFSLSVLHFSFTYSYSLSSTRRCSWMCTGWSLTCYNTCDNCEQHIYNEATSSRWAGLYFCGWWSN